eukprot:scaffold25098_cov240-Cylindrotheca_fusiformis.AAC.1
MSSTIKADQRTKRRMVLEKRTKGENIPLPNEESEHDTSVSRGLLFFLSVAPDASCPALVNKFAEGTGWKVVPGFVRTTVRSSHHPTHFETRHDQKPTRLDLESTSSKPSDEDSLNDAMPTYSPAFRRRRRKCPLSMASMRSLDDLEMEPTRSLRRWSEPE